MQLLPAIDLRRGRVVRLRHGDDAQATTYADDPLAVAAAFFAAGARRIHVVDLDAAFGEAPQRDLLSRLAAFAAAAGAGLQLGGGLRDRAAVEWTLAAGCERVVIGSLAARDPALFAELAHDFPGRLVPAVESAAGTLRVAGWRQSAAGSLEDFCATLRGLPCPAALVTDIERDGTLAGPNLDLARHVAAASGLPALLSGGIRSLADLAAAAEIPAIDGAILGRALYERRIDLAAALAAYPSVPFSSDPFSSSPSPPAASLFSSHLSHLSHRPHRPPNSGLTRRVIPCLDVAAGRVVKGVRFVDLADQGDPAEAARRYAAQGADEIVFLDITAAREGRDADLAWVRRTAETVFVPLTVGGGVRRVADASALLGAGADKVAVNSAAVRRPELLDELARRFGSQCVVLSVDVRRTPVASGHSSVAGAPGPSGPLGSPAVSGPSGSPESGAAGAASPPAWEVVIEGGRTATGRDALEWIEAGVAMGAGEVLLTSIDRDGTRGGYDLQLIAAAAQRVPVPVIASGGAGETAHLAAALAAGAAAVLAASIFHQGSCTVGDVKRALAAAGFPMREERL
jgi:cyclase